MQKYIALILLTFLAGCGFSGTPTSTKVVVYTPAGFTAASTASGSCWASSIASTRKDAFRCAVGNGILDPCFARNSASVACPSDLPTANGGTLINLTAPLPTPGTASPTQGSIWLFKLTGGNTCGAMTGTLMEPNYPYGCTGGLYCTVPAPVNTAYTSECGSAAASANGMPHIVKLKKYRVAILWR